MIDTQEQQQARPVGRKPTRDLPTPKRVMRGLRPPLRLVDIQRETGLAPSTVTWAMNGHATSRQTASAILAVFVQHGYKGTEFGGNPTTDDIFVIGQQGARTDLHGSVSPVQPHSRRRSKQQG